MTGSDQDDVLLCPWTTIKHRVSAQSVAKHRLQRRRPASSSVSTLGQVNTISGLYPSEAVQLYPQESAPRWPIRHCPCASPTST